MQSERDRKPKLRDKTQSHNVPYPIGEIPDRVMYAVGKQLVHRMAVGTADITGDDFGRIFAEAIGGIHRDKPLGIADVTWERCAWSAKTIKHKSPFHTRELRFISGRNSPTYSMGIKDPFENVEKTGRAVLEIWNERVSIASDAFDDLRVIIFLRNPDTKQYVLYEKDVQRYTPIDYGWKVNARHNFEGYDRATGKHAFTWQPHGSQFTIILPPPPPSALMFRVKQNVPTIEAHQILRWTGYQDNWIERVG